MRLRGFILSMLTKEETVIAAYVVAGIVEVRDIKMVLLLLLYLPSEVQRHVMEFMSNIV